MEETPGIDSDKIDALLRDLRSEIRGKGLDADSSEDIVQESWLRTLRHKPLCELNLRGWLEVVVARLISEQRRERRHRMDRERAAARPDRVEPSLGENDESFLLRCVRELPAPYREVVELRYLEDREIKEIAVLLDRPQTTVRSQLKRGLEHLRARLGKDSAGRSLFGVALAWLRGRKGSRSPLQSSLRFGAVAMAGGIVLVMTMHERARPEAAVRVASNTSVELGSTSMQAVEPSTIGAGRRPVTDVGEERLASRGRRLAGTVRTPEGDLVDGAQVFVGRADGHEARSIALTDQTGRFELTNTIEDEFVWARGGDWCASRRLFVPSIFEAGECDLFLTGSGERLRIHVRAPDGQPIDGARVVLNPLALSLEAVPFLSSGGTLEVFQGLETGMTDPAGIVEIPRPRGDKASIAVTASDHPTWVGEVELPNVNDVLEILLPQPARLLGRILDESGVPACKTSIEVIQDGDQVGLLEPVRFAASTDPYGSFEIEGLAPGRFVLRAAEHPVLGAASCCHEGWIEEGGDTTIDLSLSLEHTIRGRAADAHAVAGGTARLTTKEGGVWSDDRAACIGSDGSFVFPGCSRKKEHALTLHSPGRSLPWGWLNGVHPGSEEVIVNPQLSGPPLVIEFESATSEQFPSLVELRRNLPPLSFVAAVDRATGRATFPALPLVQFKVIAWVPGLGTWEAGTVEEGESREQPIRFRFPRPARIFGELVLPPGCSLTDVQGWLRMAGFNSYGFDRIGRKTMRRELLLDDSGRFTIDVLPGGVSDLMFTGAGFTAVRLPLQLEEGAEIHFPIAPEPGIQAAIHFLLPRGFTSGEIFSIEARTSFGLSELVLTNLPDLDPRRGTAFDSLVWIPVSTLELLASTDRGLEGSFALEPKWASAQRSLLQLEIVLRESTTSSVGETAAESRPKRLR